MFLSVESDKLLAKKSLGLDSLAINLKASLINCAIRLNKPAEVLTPEEIKQAAINDFTTTYDLFIISKELDNAN